MDDLTPLDSKKAKILRLLLSMDDVAVFGAPCAEESGIEEDLKVLRTSGALAAAAPSAHGGLGLGTEASGARALFHLLRLIGRRDLSLGRIFEGHVNAVQLVCRYGAEAQRRTAARDAVDGHLFAIWNTEAAPGVRVGSEGRLTGKKSFCSAAGLATRGLITVDQSDGGRLALVQLEPDQRVIPSDHGLHGMRRARTCAIDFTGYLAEPDAFIGDVGDYLREPVFSAGAWRALAVLLGGLERLVEEVRRQLVAMGRADAPAQRSRVADMSIDLETARLWTVRCADLVEGGDYRTSDAAPYVGLARRAFEQAALNLLQAAQRSVGLASLMASNPLESLMRDLTTYLRQPALDMALEEAAAYFTTSPLPRLDELAP
jgi:alkylation response protein AidB-like acyl-CoA dehydrogenase